jgi:hypothetical protein
VIGRVVVKDSTGATRSTVIDASGVYTIDVAGLTPPFVLRAEGTAGGRSYTIHSGATAADINGNLNITPLTDLIVANIARQVAANYFDAGSFASLSAAALNAAEDALQARLQAVLTGLGVGPSVDLLRTAFRTDHTGLDAALDALRVTVNPATNTATIVNVLNNASIADDLTLSSDSSLLDSTGTGNGLSDWDAIRARFASFAAAFSTGLPAANDPLLLAQFDQPGFLNDGENLAAFLGDITSSPQLVGVQFTSLSLLSLTPANASQNGSAMVAFGCSACSGPIDRWRLTGVFNSATGGTNWLLAGNGHIDEVYMYSMSWLGVDPSNPNGIQSGLRFFIGGNSSQTGIDYAVVTGPGLPASGGGADGASAGLLLVSGPFGGSFGAANSPYIGPGTPEHPRGVGQLGGHAYALTDAEIAALPADNLAYTVRFFDDNGTPTNLADDAVLATYPATLMKPPLVAGNLSASAFATVVAPSEAQLLSRFQAGGALAVTWTLPAGLAVEELEWVRLYSGGGGDSADDEGLAPTATSATLQITPPTGTATGGWLSLEAVDALERVFLSMVHAR